jgi:hypothetical protein
MKELGFIVNDVFGNADNKRYVLQIIEEVSPNLQLPKESTCWNL